MSNLYSNATYTVRDNPERSMAIEQANFEGVYEVVNNTTGIVEFISPCYPECLRLAVHWDIAVTQDQHLWPYRQVDDLPITGEAGPSGGNLVN